MNNLIKNPFERKQKGTASILWIFKSTAIALLLAGCLSSCTEKKNDVDNDCLSIFNIIHDKSASILGKWKLIKTRGIVLSSEGYDLKCYDYSRYDIVYEFKTNNVLTISGDLDIWPKIGEHFYSIVDDEKGLGMVGLPYGLKIGDNLTYWYQVTSKELIIDMRPLDGTTYYLVKIK